jgi:hypothetical protein
LQKNRSTNPSDFCCLVIVNKGAARIKSLGSWRLLLQVLFFLRELGLQVYEVYEWPKAWRMCLAGQNYETLSDLEFVVMNRLS